MKFKLYNDGKTVFLVLDNRIEVPEYQKYILTEFRILIDVHSKTYKHSLFSRFFKFFF